VAWGGRAELERRVRAPMLPPATRALFGRIGVASPARFLHVLGLGAGLGQLEPDGTVTASRHGSVLVAEGLTTGRGVRDEVFRVAEVPTGETQLGRYDVVYARFLLSRVPCASAATAWMAQQLDAAGVLLVEDVHREPDSCLADLLRAAGLHDIVVDVDPLPCTVQAWGLCPDACLARRLSRNGAAAAHGGVGCRAAQEPVDSCHSSPRHAVTRSMATEYTGPAGGRRAYCTYFSSNAWRANPSTSLPRSCTAARPVTRIHHRRDQSSS
jgi:hypothetical protein